MQTFKDAYGEQSYKEWVQCWQALGSDAPIPVIDAEMLDATGRRDPGLPSASMVAMNPTILLNTQQYRGNLEKVRTL